MVCIPSTAPPRSLPPVKYDHENVPVVGEELGEMILDQPNFLRRYIEMADVVAFTVPVKSTERKRWVKTYSRIE
jgi:hypothetical protein